MSHSEVPASCRGFFLTKTIRRRDLLKAAVHAGLVVPLISSADTISKSIDRANSPKKSLSSRAIAPYHIPTPQSFDSSLSSLPERKNTNAENIVGIWEEKTSDPQLVSIMGVSDYNYIIKTHQTTLEVPIGEINIIAGNPIKLNGQRSRFLGIRNDDPGLLPYLEGLGVGMVRIAEQDWKIKKNDQATTTVKLSNGLNYPSLLVYNPHRRVPLSQIRQDLSALPRGFVGSIEIGNEPDNPQTVFWKGQDLKSFAHFAKDAVTVCFELGLQPVLASVVNPGNNQLYKRHLLDAGVNFDQVIMAMHAYNTLEDVTQRAKVIKNIFQRPIWATEIGVKGDNKRILPAMLDEARKLGVSKAYFHQLTNNTGFGLVDQNQGNQRNPNYYILARWVKQNMDISPSEIP